MYRHFLLHIASRKCSWRRRWRWRWRWWWWWWCKQRRTHSKVKTSQTIKTIQVIHIVDARATMHNKAVQAEIQNHTEMYKNIPSDTKHTERCKTYRAIQKHTERYKTYRAIQKHTERYINIASDTKTYRAIHKHTERYKGVQVEGRITDSAWRRDADAGKMHWAFKRSRTDINHQIAPLPLKSPAGY